MADEAGNLNPNKIHKKEQQLTPKKVDRSKQNSAGFAPDFSDKFAFLLKGKSRGFFGFTTKYKMAPMGLNGPHSPG